nr:hypothetical protein [Tanacetum cinerariifolium]
MSKIPICYDDDDDEESSYPLRDIMISELLSCIEITLILSTKETKDSLIMGTSILTLFLKKESDEFIKSSVENLVPNPSESEDLSNIGRECDMPVCDGFTTFSNLHFSADDNFSSSDDKSFSDEDIPKEIFSNSLFDEETISIEKDPHHFNAESNLIESLLNKDSSIISSSKIDSLLDEFVGELIFLKSILSRIDEADCDPEEEICLIEKLFYDNSSPHSSIISSSKIDYLLDEFTGELIFLKSIPPGIDEADCDPEEEIHLIEKLLYDNSSPRPLEEPNYKYSDSISKSFSPSHIPIEDSNSLMEEIDLFFTLDDSISSGIENDDYDSEGDIIFLEEFLSNDSLSLLENKSFHFDISSSPRPLAKPPDDDGIYFDDEPVTRILTVKVVGDISEHYVLMPRLLRTQPTLCLVIHTLLLFLLKNEDKVHLSSHWGFKAF